MSKIQNPDRFLSDNLKGHDRDYLVDLLRAYGEHVREECLNWAAENADSYTSYGGGWGSDVSIVNKESILKGKTHEDLEI